MIWKTHECIAVFDPEISMVVICGSIKTGTFLAGAEYNAVCVYETGFAERLTLARGGFCFKAGPEGGGLRMKFYTIKLPRFLGGFVKAVLNTFSKN